MAWSEQVTEIQNPARKRTNMTAKQIRFFGTKRQKAALKAKRKKAHRHSSAKHRKRSKPKSNPARKKRATARHTHAPRKRRAKRRSSHRRKTVKRNPELVSFLVGNPAKRRKKVAQSRKKKRATARHSHAGHRRGGRKNVSHRHSRRRGNPAGIPLKDFAWGGGGVLGGFFGSAFLTQMFLGGSNTGPMGYGVTAAAGIGLTILANMFVKNRSFTFGVGAGAAANLIRRVAQDYTPFGGYLSAPGMGDYMVANWGPPQMTDGLNSAMAQVATSGGVMASNGISAVDYQDVRGGGRVC